jgi:hypothetical protein
MSLYRFTRPSKALRRARLDNLALVPASLLPFKSEWQAVANGLPKGGVLIILPETSRPSRKTTETVAALITANGHRVTTISAEQFADM